MIELGIARGNFEGAGHDVYIHFTSTGTPPLEALGSWMDFRHKDCVLESRAVLPTVCKRDVGESDDLFVGSIRRIDSDKAIGPTRRFREVVFNQYTSTQRVPTEQTLVLLRPNAYFHAVMVSDSLRKALQ